MSFALALATTMASCSDDDNKVEIQETDAAYVGKEVGNFTADEWYPGGKLGTTEHRFQLLLRPDTCGRQRPGTLQAVLYRRADVRAPVYTGTRVPSRAWVLLLSALPVSTVTQSMVMASARHSIETRYGNGNGYLLVSISSCRWCQQQRRWICS